MAKMDVQTNNETSSNFARKLNNNNNDEPRYLHKKFKKMAVVDTNSRTEPQCSTSLEVTEEPLPADDQNNRNVCPYCNLSCVKPSVLQKHIRAHTNERPYPCQPCGFAFKTKSNLYKHYRSQLHLTKIEGNDTGKISDIESDQSSSDVENSVSLPRSHNLPVYKPKFHKSFSQASGLRVKDDQVESRSLLSPGPLLGNTRLVEEPTPAAKRTRLHDFSESSEPLTDSSTSVDSTSVLVQQSLHSGGTLVCNSPPSNDCPAQPVCQISLLALLPYKPNLSFPSTEQQQNGVDSFLNATSPDTVRPRKPYGQLYLNGHAYTYLGLKCSTRLFYCTLNRPQPMYVTQQHGLSMYCNWKIFKDTAFHSKLDLYDSRQRPNQYTVARGPAIDLLTHSSKYSEDCPEKRESDSPVASYRFEVRDDQPKLVSCRAKSTSDVLDEAKTSENSRKVIRSLSEEHEAAQSLLCLAKTDLPRQSGLLSNNRPSTYPYGSVEEVLIALKANSNDKITHRPYFDRDENLAPSASDSVQPIDLTNKEQQQQQPIIKKIYPDIPKRPWVPQEPENSRYPSDYHNSVQDFSNRSEINSQVPSSSRQTLGYEEESKKLGNISNQAMTSLPPTVSEEKIPKVTSDEQQHAKLQLLSPLNHHHHHPHQHPILQQIQPQHHQPHPIVVKNSKNSLVSSDKITEHLFPRKVVVGGPEFRPSSPTYARKSLKAQSDYYSATHMSSSSVLSVSDDGKNVCSICNKVFSKPSQLRLHINIHYFERPYRCGSCAVSFRTKGHLTKHERSVSHHNKASMTSTFGAPTMSNPRPFKCTDCKIAFRIHGHLAKHLRSKMHIMKLECLGKLPFGTYAEIEKSNINLNNIDTTDCDNSLASLQVMAEKLYEKNPSKMKAWSNEVQYSNEISCGETSSDDGEPIISHSGDKAFHQIEASRELTKNT